MGGLKIFENADYRVRVATDANGEPWFVGKDVALMLGYANPNEAIQVHVDAEDKLNSVLLLSLSNGMDLGQRGGWLINESGLYCLMLSSKLPTAQKFRRWVTQEVLPNIRKYGTYMTPDAIQRVLSYPDTIIHLATTLKAERERRLSLEAEAERNAPKIDYYDRLVANGTAVSIRTCAKELGVKQQAFVTWLLQHKYLYRDGSGTLMPYARHDDLFAVKECRSIATGWHGVQTLITPRGRAVFLKKMEVENSQKT